MQRWKLENHINENTEVNSAAYGFILIVLALFTPKLIWSKAAAWHGAVPHAFCIPIVRS